MNKLIISLLSLILCIADTNIFSMKNIYRKQIKRLIKSYRVDNIDYKADCIMDASIHYGHPPLLLAQIVAIESSFHQYKYNKYSTAIGLMQIRTNIHKNYKGNYDIKKNIWYGAKLLYKYHVKTKNYEGALKIYGGWNVKKFRHRKKQRKEYIRKIIK
jgi:soluble lytic murein transglycosylase-like protein